MKAFLWAIFIGLFTRFMNFYKLVDYDSLTCEASLAVVTDL